jgi:OOP family OmpA-OmpF porin
MKKTISLYLAFIFCLLFISSQYAGAQLLKKIKDEVKNRSERKLVDKVGDATDNTIDKTVDVVTGKNTGESNNTADPQAETVTGKAGAPSVANYKNYDFVAGDKIIFQPDLSSEPDAELPSRFNIHNGNAEIQSFNGEKILHLEANGGAMVSPLMSTETYLPGQFTIEFDMMYENEASYFQYVNDFQVQFRDASDQNFKGAPIFNFVIDNNSRSIFGGVGTGTQNFSEALTKSMNIGNIWHHIAIYINKNIGKAYIDQYRVAATNNLPVGATKFNLKADRYGIKIRNFRLAAGGDDKYKQIVTDGKFVTHGILFDVNKSSIKPESMGTLNEIVKMMKEHNDQRFEIDGHTDSDGKGEANLKLSQDRADAVKAKLVELGIDGSRLTTKGFGASKPIDKNDTSEGKARNRRVEFIKL